MIQISEITDRRKEFAEELHAGSVFRDIQSRDKERSLYEKRWFWELLQNAKDSVKENEKVDIYLSISENEISFSHTGTPFKLDEILSLIIQGTTKTNGHSTGRFGTGFLTTYLLSKKVEITGCLTDDNGHFCFWLNRDAQELKDFYKNQQDSNIAFENSIQADTYLIDSCFQTKFKYFLDKIGKETANKGLQSLNDLIPFVQIFNDQINSICVEKNGSITRYKKEIIKKTETYQKWKLSTITDEVTTNECYAYLIIEENFDTCFFTREDKEEETVVQFDNKYPKLYYTFPLIGTEEIGIPFVINSTAFDPKVERDGIYLISDQGSLNEIENNKNIVETALIRTISVIQEICNHTAINNVFEFFNFPVSRQLHWLDLDWFNRLKYRLFSTLKDSPIISITSSNEKQRLSDLSIPYSKKEGIAKELWQLLDNLPFYKVVNFSEIENWIEIYSNHSLIEENDIYEQENIIGIKKLIVRVEQLTKLENLTPKTISNIDWINKFYNTLINDLELFPLNKKIMLNQENEFRIAEYIYWDNSNDDELLNISNKMGICFKQKLISKEIIHLDITGVDKFEKENAVSEILTKLNQYSTEEYQNTAFQEANAMFMSWLIINSRKELLNDLKVISFDRDIETKSTIIQSFQTGKHLLLAPRNFFMQEFPLYSEIIRERDCLHPIYCDFLNAENFQWLHDFGFIHYSPLVERTEKMDANTAEMLIENPDELSSIKDEEGKLKYDIVITYTDFAYLTGSEGHIYNRNSSTISSTKILNFLLNEATVKDQEFQGILTEIKVEESLMLHYNKSLWLKRARNLQWVYVKNSEGTNENKFNRETPSSKNLSELIKNNPKLIQTIKGELQISFLTKIGVGVSDLIRNTLASDDIRISWDKALTSMITSNVDPELAQEIFSDPNIQTEYNRRIKERKLIKRNQEIGALVEALFSEVIREQSEMGVNITIKREPWGSDYLLTDDSSDLVNSDNREEIFKINNWLVELKASGRDYAAMTSLQAQTAVEQKENYALIVVPLDGSEPDMEYVRSNAKVICTIGSILSPTIEMFNEIEVKKNNIRIYQEGVSVDIEDERIRFRVNSTLWFSNGKSITEFISECFKR